jgi:DNA-directed RNA polymerase I subunit RPA2
VFDEDHPAVDYFGEQLGAAGYNYYGNEPMYSGVYGTELRADIFIGVVYYQRLRHMVKDKFQVRSTGPVNQLTRQPVKGRKAGGGIRFGEMERDALLAHGTSFLLKDRLMNCSDAHNCWVCDKCGSLLAPSATPATAALPAGVTCLSCKTDEGIRVVQMPYVFRYLANELAAMNVRMRMDIGKVSSRPDVRVG